jgi:hypothetical protein
VFETVPETADQVTPELKLPVPATVAEHWLAFPGCRLLATQLTVTEVMVGEGGGGVLLRVTPPQPAEHSDPRNIRLSKVLHLIALVLTNGQACRERMG